MTLQCFSVFDSAAGAFLRPFWAETIEMAIRTFRQIVQDPEHQFGQFPEDYTLFHLGSVDQKTGELETLATPHSLGLAVTFLPQTPKVVNDA